VALPPFFRRAGLAFHPVSELAREPAIGIDFGKFALQALAP